MPGLVGRPAPSDSGRAAAAVSPSGRWQRADVRGASVFVVFVVLTQRLGVPFQGTVISVALPMLYVAVGLLLARRRLTLSRGRVELYLLGMAGILAATAAVTVRGESYSTSSLMLLVTIYLPWTLRAAGTDGAWLAHRLGRTFVNLMVVLGALGTLQLAAQLLGVWTYQDLLGQIVPAQYFVPDYNTDAPLYYGADVMKANAFVLLEPSFLSQFCALAIIVGIVVRARVWKLLVLAAGLASAVSGTGIILLIAGAVLLLFREPHRIRPAYLLAGAVALVVILTGPTAPFLLDRTGEVTMTGSSGNTRFVAPYVAIANWVHAHPLRAMIGVGAGNEQTLAIPGVATQDANFTAPLKLVLEYGVLAGGLFTILLLFGMLSGAPWRVVPGSVVVMTFALSGALLQPQTAVVAWALTGLCSRDGRRAAAPTSRREPLPAARLRGEPSPGIP